MFNMNLIKQLTINVEGWPERVVQMLEKLIQSFNPQQRDKRPNKVDAQLPLWPGVSVPPEKLRRIEIYKDAD